VKVTATCFFCALLLFALLVGAFAGGAGSEFEPAVPGRTLAFPRDHGKHPRFQTEWWYFTGNVQSEDGSPWGFQLTFFRRGIIRKPRSNASAWAVRDLYPAHLALTDVKNGKFFHSELLSREGPGLAEASVEDLSVRVKDWLAQRLGPKIHISARKDARALDLDLVPQKPLVLHGESGYSQKGDSKDQASYYYSFTRLKAEGTITAEGITHRVSGTAWMDHEFGSSIVKQDQAGWDWFSIQLDDETELMVFHMRKKDGKPERRFGTFVHKDGRVMNLANKRVVIVPQETWTSPRTRAVYPSGWSIRIPDLKIDLRVTPAMKDQEITSEKSTGIVYWEGAVTVKGNRNGHEVQGKGYVELTGYAHSMSGRL